MQRRPDHYQLHVPMPRELRERLARAAAAEHRSMCEHIRYLIDKHTPNT